MLTHNLGYPRIGKQRELKRACEQYWSGKIDLNQLLDAGKERRKEHWLLQQEAGIDLIPCNDFSYYDHVLDLSLMLGVTPARYDVIRDDDATADLDLYFAMARGCQKDGVDVIAMEMTKWFDTNYHYIVPEFSRDQTFKLTSRKVIDEYLEAKALGINAKPVLIGPVSYLLLGKEKEEGFNRIELLKDLLPVYCELLNELRNLGAEYVQMDEPFLVLDLDDAQKNAFKTAYAEINKSVPGLKLIIATYFDALADNTELALNLPVDTLHIDLAHAPEQLGAVLAVIPDNKNLSLGIIDGRNVWKNNYSRTLDIVAEAQSKLGEERIIIAPSCSLLHSPCDLDEETDEASLPQEIKHWMAFARQKLDELVAIASLGGEGKDNAQLEDNITAIESREQSTLIHKADVKTRMSNITDQDAQRHSPFSERQKKQRALLKFPLLPTTTIGSFPQTAEVRQLRAQFKRGEISVQDYDAKIEGYIDDAVKWQEDIGIDVLVHGEFERNDMVQYFGELLEGFVFTKNGWVQSYGSRCVKPPIIFGDVERKLPMTVKWAKYAQSKTTKVMKGMLTGPVTILKWSFVRDDQAREDTALQIALAIRDEVCDLEQAGIKVIQIDEAAFREGLPLRRKDWASYLQWAVRVFRISASGVRDETQIHTHMCYSEFNDIIESIADMDADVITIETSRSQMELLDAFADFKYPNEVGPGVYDIHSPRVPTTEEMVSLINKAMEFVPVENIWINPDCGLKTRGWDETREALENMIAAAQQVRAQLAAD